MFATQLLIGDGRAMRSLLYEALKRRQPPLCRTFIGLSGKLTRPDIYLQRCIHRQINRFFWHDYLAVEMRPNGKNGFAHASNVTTYRLNRKWNSLDGISILKEEIG